MRRCSSSTAPSSFSTVTTIDTSIERDPNERLVDSGTCGRQARRSCAARCATTAGRGSRFRSSSCATTPDLLATYVPSGAPFTFPPGPEVHPWAGSRAVAGPRRADAAAPGRPVRGLGVLARPRARVQRAGTSTSRSRSGAPRPATTRRISSSTLILHLDGRMSGRTTSCSMSASRRAVSRKIRPVRSERKPSGSKPSSPPGGTGGTPGGRSGSPTPPGTGPRSRVGRRTLAGFTTLGLFWGAWASVLPSVQDATELSKGALGVALLFVSVGSIPAMFFVAAPLVARLGARAVAYSARRLRGARRRCPG